MLGVVVGQTALVEVAMLVLVAVAARRVVQVRLVQVPVELLAAKVSSLAGHGTGKPCSTKKRPRAGCPTPALDKMGCGLELDSFGVASGIYGIQRIPSNLGLMNQSICF